MSGRNNDVSRNIKFKSNLISLAQYTCMDDTGMTLVLTVTWYGHSSMGKPLKVVLLS